MHPLGRKILLGFLALLLGVNPILLRSHAVRADGLPSLVDDMNAITPQALQQLSSSLPSDPVQAATTLVAQIYGPDEIQANLAVAELLRRSGIPIVSPDGPVIGDPDNYILYDAPIYNGLIPTLTRSVRSGGAYVTDDMIQLLAAIGVTPDPLPAKALIGALGQWGKSPDDPPEIRTTAAAIRALAAFRGQIAYPEADPKTFEFDALTTTLLVANFTSRVGIKIQPTGSTPGSSPFLAFWERWIGVTPVYASTPCDDLKNMTKGMSADEAQAADATKKYLRGEIIGAVKKQVTDTTGAAIDTAVKAVDKGTAALSTILLLLGAQLNLYDDHNQFTHFYHDYPQSERDVTLTAQAAFDSALAQKYLACYQLAGIDVPPNGKLVGFRVIWSLFQDQGLLPSSIGHYEGYGGTMGKYLAVVAHDSYKTTKGDVTGEDGTSTITLFPELEEKPPKKGKPEPPLQYGHVTVKASLDKQDFPFKLADIQSMKDPKWFLASKLIDTGLSILKKAGLPSQEETVTVEYHGPDIYLAKGKVKIRTTLFSDGIPATLDMYTCTGLDGPWKGTFDLNTTGLSQTAVLQGIKKLCAEFSVSCNEVDYHKDLQYTFNAEDGIGSFDILQGLTGVIKLDRIPTDNKHLDGVVGKVELQLEGGEGIDLTVSLSDLIGTLEVPVKGVDEDDRCPGGGYHYVNHP